MQNRLEPKLPNVNETTFKYIFKFWPPGGRELSGKMVDQLNYLFAEKNFQARHP